MASQASVPRSVPAGDREQQQQQLAQEGLRRSGRVKKTLPTYSNPETAHRPPREGDRGTPGPRKESPGTSWGERSSGESTSTFSSRVVAMLREYEDAGKALTELKEELREARILNTRASSKEKPVTSQRLRALRDEVARLVLLREGIEKSAGPFLERFKNQRRFSEMKGLNTSGEPPAGVLSDEEEEDADVVVTGVLQAGTSLESEPQSRQQGSGLPARQRTPTAQAGVSAEEEEEGGLLQEIRQLESPVNLDRFSFGEDEPAEETKKRKKKTKETAREVVVQMAFEAKNGEKIQQTVMVNDEENVAAFYVNSNNISSTVLYDYNHDIIGFRRINNPKCLVVEMNDVSIPSMSDVLRVIKHFQQQNATSDSDLSYDLVEGEEADRTTLGVPINILCSDVPIHWATQNKSPRLRWKITLRFSIFGIDVAFTYES
ncbi:uncharacterized protein LOC143764173 isoform X1 [Ranitomeya variabilis]|uniref:uncharacterized protein LOC143764173 isoform X1 n=1 Tax=Ranitomeya variabilis TaxID=490064 RepID=UPI0040565BF1